MEQQHFVCSNANTVNIEVATVVNESVSVAATVINIISL